MNKTQKIGWIGITHSGLSLLYIVLMFVFAASDSPYFNKNHAAILVACYGFLLFILGIVWLQLIVGKEALRQLVRNVTYSINLEENILDEKEVNGSPGIIPKNKKVDFVLIVVHLLCAFCLFSGQTVWGIEYAFVMTMGFVYAMFWGIMGIFFMSMIKA